jgi:acyl-coenzyme A synthetase/AMP-(fatty) acid ligase
MNFEAFSYIKVFKQFQPTYISLIPRHYEILKQTKEWNNWDMSCVRYMVTGSGNITQEMIDAFRERGVKTVANWYGMTEMPPPVFVGYNTASFDFTAKEGYTVDFTDEGECVINGFYTGDLFDVKNKLFLKRKVASDGNTWKT